MPPSDLLYDPLGGQRARAPRLLVLANGAPVPGAGDAMVLSAGGFCADRFHIRGALTNDTAAWAGVPDILIDVRMALSPYGEFVSLVLGRADHVSIDPIAGTFGIEGRDLSAGLIEARTQEIFANRTSSEIAALLAARHGLAADAQPTTTPVGRYWELEHDTLSLNAGARGTTEWDLLVTLALHEGFDLWVSGATLYFRAPNPLAVPAVLNAAATPFGPANVTRLRLDHALTFAGDIVVTVKSWHSRAGTGTAQTASTQRGGARSREYVYVVPNLTPEAALRYARARLAELTAHELTFTAEMPGELAMFPRAPVMLAGTGTVFDTTYRIDEVERRLSARDGFSQMVRARAAAV